MKKKEIMLVLILFLNVLVFIKPGESTISIAWTANGVAVCTAFEDQDFVQIVSDGQGGAIISWESWSYPDSYLYAQRIDSNGFVQWNIDGISICNKSVFSSSSRIASDGEGGAFIVWEDERDWNNTKTDIYIQKINPNGTVKWASNGLEICTAESYQIHPQVISDKAGGVIVTWADERFGNPYSSHNTHDIYSQKIDSSGTIQWTPNGTEICTADNFQLFPQLVSDQAGGAIITWHDNRSGILEDIYAQRIDSDGNIKWTPNGKPICTANGYQNAPMIVNDEQGGVIIAWDDGRNMADGADIYAQKIDFNGNIYWSSNGTVICNASDWQQKPGLVSDGQGGAIIAWEDYRNYATTECDIYAQKIDSNGISQWSINGLEICTYDYFQYGQKLVNDGQGGVIIAWEDERGSGSDIYAQWIAANGSLQWEADGSQICIANDFQTGQQLACNGSGSVITAWKDKRDYVSTGSDVYAQKMLYHYKSSPSGTQGISFTHYYILFMLVSVISLVIIIKTNMLKEHKSKSNKSF
ncbi:MAG: hypothetical protein ACFE9S_03270 [Candidatus Hermodarchaeota archaeon]